MKKLILLAMMLILISCNNMSANKNTQTTDYFSIEFTDSNDELINVEKNIWSIENVDYPNEMVFIEIMPGIKTNKQFEVFKKAALKKFKMEMGTNKIFVQESNVDSLKTFDFGLHFSDISIYKHVVFNGKFTYLLSLTTSPKRITNLLSSLESISFNVSDPKVLLSQNRPKEIPKTISRKEALSDFDTLVKYIRINPNINRMYHKNMLDKDIKSIQSQLEKNNLWKRREIISIFSEFLAKYGDGHTNLPVNDINKKFPLPVIIRENSIYIAPTSDKNFSQDLVEILNIDNISAKEIISQGLKHVATDKGFTNWQYYMLEKNFGDYLNLIIGEKNSIDLKIKKNETTTEEIKLDLGSIPFKRQREISYDYLNKYTAILSIKSLMEENINFTTNLNRIFREFKRKDIKNLIIDNRENSGGYIGYTYQIISHLKKSFKGHVYCLVDRGTFSAGVYLTQQMKKANIPVIGEDLGGFYNCTYNPSTLVLPNSYITLSVANSYNDTQKSYPVKPDVYVKLNPKELALGKDPILHEVMKMIDNKVLKEHHTI